jgi:hypothetical protein
MGSVIEVPLTGIDMASFEDACDECVCHLFPGGAIPHGATFSYCGVPREEQGHHGVVRTRNGRCTGCGRPRCPACLAGWSWALSNG